jgi:hypothetical protein
MKLAIHRACAHPSARACQFVLAFYAAGVVAELICTLTGVPLP